MWFCMIEIAGNVVSWGLSYYFFGRAFPLINIPEQKLTPAQASAVLGPTFQTAVSILPALLLVSIIAFAALTLGFRDLAKVDREEFSGPSKLMILMIVGAAVDVVVAIPLLNGVPALISQAPATPGGPISPAFASMAASEFHYFIVITLGGILALVGIIGGLIFGLWRLGARYNATIVKVGAIFTIIPPLNVVAAILVLIGTYQAKSRLA